MKKTTAIFAGFLLAACGQNEPVQSASEVEQAVIELPEFNTYSDSQMAVLSAFGMADFDASKISTVPLRDGFGVIFGYGGNVLVSVGEDGVIMVDNQFPEVHGALLDEVKKLSGLCHQHPLALRSCRRQPRFWSIGRRDYRSRKLSDLYGRRAQYQPRPGAISPASLSARSPARSLLFRHVGPLPEWSGHHPVQFWPGPHDGRQSGLFQDGQYFAHGRRWKLYAVALH